MNLAFSVILSRLKSSLLPVLDRLLLLPLAFGLPFYLLFARIGGRRLPISRQFLKTHSLYPIRDHYYQPLFNDAHLLRPLSEPRFLPGLNLSLASQLTFLKNLVFEDELLALRFDSKSSCIGHFSLENGHFESGDAEFLYQMIRHCKPSTILEIGSGYSTIISCLANDRNYLDSGVKANHICVEPYEMPWLEMLNVTVVRASLQKCGPQLILDSLHPGDLLFIDSSHIIRPQGDVLIEYLEIIPLLKSGVIVHVHDIFTPRDYLDSWIKHDVLFWNEQYLLEALLCNTSRYEILAALNFLHHESFDELSRVCPYLTKDREPGSLYFIIK